MTTLLDTTQSQDRSSKLWKRFVRSVLTPVLETLFRLHLGWLLGHTFVIVTHVGRRSGKIRRTILYVQYFDSQTREITVVSVWGKSDWYRNLCAAPAPFIESGRDRYVPDQRLLSTDEIAEIERRFRRNHPIVARAQCWLMRWPWDCSEDEFMRFASALRGVTFRPQTA